jgi:hypothetical protein
MQRMISNATTIHARATHTPTSLTISGGFRLIGADESFTRPSVDRVQLLTQLIVYAIHGNPLRPASVP